MDRNTSPVVPSRHPAWLDRLLKIFSDVRPGESVTVLLMLANIFLILVCYYVIKTIREPLILEGGGAEIKSYAAAGQALILMAFIPLYSWLASRVHRVRLIVAVTLFFVVNIELFSVAVGAALPYIGVVFFIWVGFFSLTIIAQFWSYANDIYSKPAGNRLFPIIGIGMTAGPPFGTKIAESLFSTGVKPDTMLHISALLLLLSLGLYALINRRETRLGFQAEVATEALAKGNGFSLVFRSRYIKLIALLFILLNLVNTTGEYIISRLVVGQAEAAVAADPSVDAGAFIGAFYGNYFFWINVVAVLLQAFVVSRAIKYGGLRLALLALPFTSLGAYGIIAGGVGFSVVRWSKTAENSTDYSIMNTARQLLWLPTSREEKYKAKQAVDTFFVRLGDVLSALFVFVGTTIVGLDVVGFASGNVLLALVWIGVTLLILKEHRKLTEKQETLGAGVQDGAGSSAG